MTAQTLSFTRKDTQIPITATLCKLDTLPKKTETDLHPKEIELRDTFKSQKRQTDYTLGRLAAKQALKTLYPQIPSSEIHISKSIPGYPIIEHPKIHNQIVSISHTNRQAVAIISPEHHPIAIDIETINSKRAHVIESILCSEEFKFLSQNPEERIHQLFTLWSAKEALSKQLRTGFTIPKSLLEVKTLTPTQIKFQNFPIYTATTQFQNKLIQTIIHPKNSSFLLQ